MARPTSVGMAPRSFPSFGLYKDVARPLPLHECYISLIASISSVLAEARVYGSANKRRSLARCRSVTIQVRSVYFILFLIYYFVLFVSSPVFFLVFHFYFIFHRFCLFVSPYLIVFSFLYSFFFFVSFTDFIGFFFHSFFVVLCFYS